MGAHVSGSSVPIGCVVSKGVSAAWEETAYLLWSLCACIGKSDETMVRMTYLWFSALGDWHCHDRGRGEGEKGEGSKNLRFGEHDEENTVDRPAIRRLPEFGYDYSLAPYF